LVAGTASSDTLTRPLTDDEIAWLRHLSEGNTVTDLADRVGYSERMMYRLLADIYKRLVRQPPFLR
jgi:DNA-binding CsgD family transcriptional regulator